jgi:hypothetical protein
MPAFSRASLAALLASVLALMSSGCGRPEAPGPANHIGYEEFIAGIRAGQSLASRIPPSVRGWDNDAVIDALAEIIAQGQKVPKHAAAGALAYHHGIQRPEGGKRPRGVDFMLPARVAPVLLTALRDEDVDERRRTRYRQNLLIALGSIDAPTLEVITAVRQALVDDDPRVVASATRAAGMLGRHAADMAGDLEGLLDVDSPGHWAEADGRQLWTADRAEIAGALARVSDGPHVRALEALILSAREGDKRHATRAVEHLRDLGPRAVPAIDDLEAILHESRPTRPTVAAAIVAISPARLATTLSLLTDASMAQDESTVLFADRELLDLSREWGDSDEMRAAVPRLIAVLDARPAADGLLLSKALRRIDTRRAREAYVVYVRRERRERGASGTEWIP